MTRGILLLARTDARMSRGFDEALARIREFVAAGADILFLDSPQSEEEMRSSIEAFDGKPALAITSPAGKHFMPADAGLERIGIRIVVYPQDILAASVRAMRGALTGQRRLQAAYGHSGRTGNSHTSRRISEPGRALARSDVESVRAHREPPYSRRCRAARDPA